MYQQEKTTQLFKSSKDLNRHFAKEGTQMCKKPMKRCQDQFPTAGVVGNYHKPGDLKQHSFITLQFWKSEVHNRPLRAKAEIYSGLFFLRFQGRICFFPRLPSFLGQWAPAFQSQSNPSHAASLLPSQHLLQFSFYPLALIKTFMITLGLLR